LVYVILFDIYIRGSYSQHIHSSLYQDRREDTVLQLSHFRRHKRKTSKKPNGKTTNYPFHKPEENHPPGKDSAKKISNLIGEAAKYAGSTKSKKVRSADNLTNWILTVATIIIYHQLYFLVVMSLPQKLRQESRIYYTYMCL
jgi:hypothetical protein